MSSSSHHFMRSFIGIILMTSLLSNLVQSQDLCEPGYGNGCSDGDGFTDFAVEQIENYGSGCANLNGTGWSQYTGLGPALLIPGETYDFVMRTGYSNQNVSIWIDFNNDFELTQDERILFDFNLDNSGVFYTAEVEIPLNAQPGQHYMRARTNWGGSCDDPCEDYNYGEAEDYLVVVGDVAFGGMNGLVSALTGGLPVENAEISLSGEYSFYTTTSAANGTYQFQNVLTGAYQIKCEKAGYNIITDSVDIEENLILNHDFHLTQPTIDLSTNNISATLGQNTSTMDEMELINNGDGPLNWSASVALQSKNAKDYLDLQFEYPVQGLGGESGIETDGEYIYTTIWTGNQILKYDLNGNYLGSFTIDGVSALRDLAYDGTYFYGSAAIPVVFEMDFTNQELVGSFNAPVSVRALAYNDNGDFFYSGSWDGQITMFDKSGVLLGSFFTGPIGGVYSGLAYDNVSVGGPYLWGYGAAEGSQNVIVQMQLPAGNETGFFLDMEEILAGPVFNAPGGLFTHPNLVFGKWTLGGLVQNQSMWGLEIGDAQTWLGIDPNGGTLLPGEFENLSVIFDATDMPAGIYNAEIHFTSWPDVGSPVVDIEMTVTEFFYFPCEFYLDLNCTDLTLNWEMCPGGAPDPDSFNVYRNENLIATTYGMTYSDSLLYPDTTYEFGISYFIDGVESAVSPAGEMVVPLPDGLEPQNLGFYPSGDDFILFWEKPSACVAPDLYNIYRDGTFLAGTSDTSLVVEGFGNEYFVTAVYYFGESGPSNMIVVTEVPEENQNLVEIFPNPASDQLNIRSNTRLDRYLIYNARGEVMLEDHPTGTDISVDISDFEPGLYFLILETSLSTIERKMVVY